MPDMPIRRTLNAVTLGAADEAAVATSVEGWYSDTMDRLSGLYKRKTQGSLPIVGLALALAVNANLIHVTTVLWNTPAARDKANVLALNYAKQHTRPHRDISGKHTAPTRFQCI